MGQSFYEQTQRNFKAVAQQLASMDNQLMSLSHVLKEIVGKELMRQQALHKVLMDKGLFTDEDLKTALETLVAEAKADLEKQAKEVEEQKQAKVEILVPNTVRANSNQDPTPTPAVVPVTEAINVPTSTDGQV